MPAGKRAEAPPARPPARSSAGFAQEMGTLACIIVTYDPDLHILKRLLEALPEDSPVVLVDNASAGGIPGELGRLVATRRRIRLLVNDRNLGLAAAINRGVREARHTWPETRFALFLDQDSEPEPGSLEALMNGFAHLEGANPPVGCIGPSLVDAATGLHHGFHQHTRWRWKRTYPGQGSTRPVPCANLNGSGTLVSIALFLELDGLEETLFIDHVDTEWAFRVQAAGYGLYGIPQARFLHRMGEDTRRIWLFGWRVWPMRSPKRHYYLFRNAVILMRRDYVPRVWKNWAIIKLLLTAGVHAFIDPRRKTQLRCMLNGLRDGMRNPAKRKPSA